MMGCYDFCGHYEWTFDWLERAGGPALLRAYWDEAIHRDSQWHARAVILREGFAGMAKYWQHTLAEESPELAFRITQRREVFRIDMHDCPSKGFLLRNGLQQHRDYCDHCIGWIGPLMREAGFVIDHEHNHRGQCWWEFRAAPPRSADDAPPAPWPRVDQPDVDVDVTLRPEWKPTGTKMDRFRGATSPDEKQA